ncbi:MAG TPA: hypothetical protein VN578_04135, partial [Candidatus Binatia bacterium]|nr:hypothetical protein [Candidatus Binatia bacterium]
MTTFTGAPALASLKRVCAVAGLAVCISAEAANLTWNGSVSPDWFNPTNWTPSVVPGPDDTLNFSSGTINLSAPVTINGQFNWSGGTLSGSPMTITTNGLLSLGGSSSKFLDNALTNAGTVAWSGTGNFYVYNNNGAPYRGA